MMMRTRLRRIMTVRLLLIQLVLVVCCGCAQRTYLKLVTPVEKLGIVDENTDRLYLKAMDRQTGEPIAGLKITIASSKGPIELIADKNGIIEIPISAGLKKENPRIIMSRRGGVLFQYAFTVGGKEGMRHRVEVSGDGMQRLGSECFAVWYESGLEDEARKVEKELRREYDLMARATGITPVEYGIALIREKKPGTIYTVRQWQPTFGAYRVWCYSVGEVEKARFRHVSAHEWTEATLTKRLRLEHSGEYPRFVADGLAEYGGFLSGGVGRGDAMALRALLGKGTLTVDLLQKFRQVEIASVAKAMQGLAAKAYPEGYPLSFVFWYKLTKEEGDDFPRRFIEEFGRQKKRDSETAIRTIERLTKRDDIRARLTKADVQEAIRTIEELENAGVPGAGN